MRSAAADFSRSIVAWSSVPAKQPELELVERIERAAAMLDRAAAAFDRVLDALQRDQRVDSAQGAQRDGRALALAGRPLPQSEKVPPDARRAAAGAVARAVPFGP